MLMQADLTASDRSSWPATNTASSTYSWSGNTVTTELTSTISAENVTNLNLDVQWIWTYDTQQALRERWQMLNPTNDFVADAPDSLKPTVFGWKKNATYNTNKDQRNNLVEFKSYINSILSSFVDINEANTNGNYDTFFETPSRFSDENKGWVWSDTSFDGTNDTWVFTNMPSSLPVLTLQSFCENIAEFPHEVVSTVVTNTVDGWKIGNYSVYQTNTVHTNTTYTKTWFDYTPYRDLGGWADGVSGVQTGTHRFTISMVVYATNLVEIWDACGDSMYYDLTSNTNTNGVVTSVDLEIFDSQTNSLYSAAYTNATVYTNTVVCTNSNIAAGFNEGDYGYSVMQGVISNLVWTEASSRYRLESVYASGTTNRLEVGELNNTLGWGAAKTAAENDPEYDSVGNLRPAEYSSGFVTGESTNEFQADYSVVFAGIEAYNIPTNFTYDAQSYLYAMAGFSWAANSPLEAYEDWFDASGTDLRFNKFSLIETWSDQTATNLAYSFGNTNLTYTWVDAPTHSDPMWRLIEHGPDTNYTRSTGYFVNGIETLIKWNASTNGFSY
jgi:hypothetical protein